MRALLLRFRTGSLVGPVLLLLLVHCSTTHRSAVRDSILGVRIGSDLEEARQKLSPLAESSPPDEEDDEREGGKKEAWVLKGTEFRSVALQTDRNAKVVWVTGFVRAGREIPFARLGDVAAALRATQSEAIWNVASAHGGYKLVAKGQNGRAHVIYLLSLAAPVE